ncbi:pH-response regulator protein [Yarrowia sp. E02]|nr:pH-response regulator protein [Yarrowia sp. E02]
MSLSYTGNLPTTSPLSLSQHITSERYQQVIENADSARARVREQLKHAKKTNGTDPDGDIMPVIKALEEYLSQLSSIVDNEGAFRFLSQIVTCWRLPFQSQSSMANKTSLHGLSYEYVMVLFTYALALATLANQYVARDKEDRWKHASAYISKARGVVDYLRQCRSFQIISSEPPASVPRDLTSATMSAFSHMLCGSSHMLILYKCDSETYLDGGAPSAGANSGGFSSSLLLRTAIFARDQFETASALLGEPVSKRKLVTGLVKEKSSKFSLSKKLNLKKDDGSAGLTPASSADSNRDLSTSSSGTLDSMLSWLSRARGVAEGFVFKHMAIQAYGNNQIGKAVGASYAAILQLEDIKIPQKSALYTPVTQLKETLKRHHADYKADNDRLSFEIVPSPSELAQEWPSGRQVIAAQKWTPQANLDLGEDSSAPKYSGQGSYY